jgi:hypothetical protein
VSGFAEGDVELSMFALPPNKEFSELRDWFAEWKRDNPLSFWVAILLPWVYAVISIGVPATLISAFPFSDARQALTLPPEVGALSHTRIICKLPSGSYIFGYELVIYRSEKNPLMYFGRVCRDVVKGGWVLMKADLPDALK